MPGHEIMEDFGLLAGGPARCGQVPSNSLMEATSRADATRVAVIIPGIRRKMTSFPAATPEEASKLIFYS